LKELIPLWLPLDWNIEESTKELKVPTCTTEERSRIQ